MLIHFNSMNNIVPGVRISQQQNRRSGRSKNPFGKLKLDDVLRFFRRENPASISGVDRFPPSDREARNITSRTCGIPQLERERDSIVLSRCRRCTRIFCNSLQTHHTSLDQQCSPFISCSRIAAETRLRKSGTRQLYIELIYLIIVLKRIKRYLMTWGEVCQWIH